MPDITMCEGTGCPLRKHCYRFVAKPDDWQTYFVDTPYNKETKSCAHYWWYKPQTDKAKKD